MIMSLPEHHQQKIVTRCAVCRYNGKKLIQAETVSVCDGAKLGLETDDEGNTKSVRKSQGNQNLDNKVYISDNGTIIIEASDSARIVTCYTANEYANEDKDTRYLVKAVKLCNIESLDISIPPEDL